MCTTEFVDVLATRRGISNRILLDNNIRWNTFNNSWVIPTYNSKGSMNNLYKVFFGDNEKLLVIGTPSLESTLMSWPQKPKDEVWLQEGHWDKLAGEEIVGPRDIDNIGVPGSGFKQTWCNAVAGKRLVIFTDNDDAGHKQKALILKRIEASPQKPREIMAVKWPEDKKEGYDVNDVLREYGVNAYQWLREHLEPVQTASEIVENEITADTSCSSFLQLIEDCKQAYYFTYDMELMLLFMTTALYSLKIEGEQIWGRFIGPPGSSKTTQAKIVGASDQTVMRSTFTGLLSGWKDDEAGDASLIPLIAGKALIVKDADALLKQPDVNRIFSELRDFYDKDTSVTYRNRISLEYKNIRSVFMLLGTHVLRGIDNAALGDRFLDFELRVTEEDRDAIAQKVLIRSILVGETGSSPENNVWAKAKGLIDHHLLPMSGVAKLNDETCNEILEFCKLIAFMRAPVERNKQTGEIAYKPHAEVPSRLVGQFTKLLLCAPRVLGLDEPNKLVMDLFHRVVLDVIDRESHRYKIAKLLVAIETVDGVGLTRDQIAEGTGISTMTVTRELENMLALEMVKVITVRAGVHTAIPHISLTEKIHRQVKLLAEKENGQI